MLPLMTYLIKTIPSLNDDPAIHAEQNANHVTCDIGCDEKHGMRDFLGDDDPANRHQRTNRLARTRSDHRTCQHRSVHQAGTGRIHPYPVGDPIIAVDPTMGAKSAVALQMAMANIAPISGGWIR